MHFQVQRWPTCFQTGSLRSNHLFTRKTAHYNLHLGKVAGIRELFSDGPRTTPRGGSLVDSKGWSRESVQCQLSGEIQPATRHTDLCRAQRRTGRQLAPKRQVSCCRAAGGETQHHGRHRPCRRSGSARTSRTAPRRRLYPVKRLARFPVRFRDTRKCALPQRAALRLRT